MSRHRASGTADRASVTAVAIVGHHRPRRRADGGRQHEKRCDGFHQILQRLGARCRWSNACSNTRAAPLRSNQQSASRDAFCELTAARHKWLAAHRLPGRLNKQIAGPWNQHQDVEAPAPQHGKAHAQPDGRSPEDRSAGGSATPSPQPARGPSQLHACANRRFLLGRPKTNSSIDRGNALSRKIRADGPAALPHSRRAASSRRSPHPGRRRSATRSTSSQGPHSTRPCSRPTSNATRASMT